MRVKVVINPAAGKAGAVLSVLNDVFGPAGIDWDVAITHVSGDGELAAREAAEQGFDLIGVYGGDGTVTEVVSVLAAVVANSASTGLPGVKFANDVDVSDGVLDLFIVEDANLLGWLGSAADAIHGGEPRMFTRWRGRKIRVEASPAQAVLADGGDSGTTPIDVTVSAGAVRVLVPTAVAGGQS